MFARIKRTIWRGIEGVLLWRSLFESRLDMLGWRRRLTYFLHGEGIEIGALHQPLPLAGTHVTRIRYVDRRTIEQLRRKFPELASYRLTPSDVIDDGEALHHFSDASLDFVIANHLIEHTRNPIGTLKVWIGKLKPGGVVWMAVPHRNNAFDADRPLTSIEHLIDDDLLPPEARKERDFEHYLEWSRVALKKTGEAIDQHARQLAQSGDDIHFHTFVGRSFLEIVKYLQDKQLLPIDILAYVDSSEKTGEFLLVILKRRGIAA